MVIAVSPVTARHHTVGPVPILSPYGSHRLFSASRSPFVFCRLLVLHLRWHTSVLPWCLSGSPPSGLPRRVPRHREKAPVPDSWVGDRPCQKPRFPLCLIADSRAGPSSRGLGEVTTVRDLHLGLDPWLAWGSGRGGVSSLWGEGPVGRRPCGGRARGGRPRGGTVPWGEGPVGGGRHTFASAAECCPPLNMMQVEQDPLPAGQADGGRRVRPVPTDHVLGSCFCG